MVPRGSEKFPKTARLKKRPEFLRLSRTGNKIHSANFIVISKKTDAAESRLGVTVSGKVGNAVVRNKIKRLVREYFRRQRELITATDTLVIARPSAKGVSYASVASELKKAWTHESRKR